MTTTADTLRHVAAWCEAHGVDQIISYMWCGGEHRVHVSTAELERISGGRGEPTVGAESDTYDHRFAVVDGVTVVALYPLAHAAQPPLPSGGDLDGAGLGGGE